MDGSRFDTLVRLISEDASRRGLLRSAFAATVAGFGATSLLSPEDAAAKSCKARCNKKKTKKKKAKCKKNCNQNNERCASEGSVPFPGCTIDAQCCSSQNLVCDVPFGASSSDKNCCRGTGASCDLSPTGPKCCTGEANRREFECVGGFCRECPGGLCP